MDSAFPDEPIEKGPEILEGLPGPPKMVRRHQVAYFWTGALAARVPSVQRVLLSPWEVKRLIEQHDEKTIRCPRVGGDVNFRFCRFENNMLPCRWIAGCWQTQMDINTFLQDHYSKEELDQIFAPPKPKIESLLNLVEKAKKVNQEDE